MIADSMYMTPLDPHNLTDIYITFMDAFSDYPVAFHLTKEQFARKFVQKLNLDFSLSAGAHNYDGSLAGFIFTALSEYEGKLTAYNGGTGVRPRYRGNQLTTQMYEYLLPLLESKKVKQCVLEVLTSNERAIKAYERIGFKKTKYFKCYALSKQDYNETERLDQWRLIKVDGPNWELYEKFYELPPSFLDSQKMIDKNLENEIVIELQEENKCIGFAIYQPTFGRISQIGTDPNKRNQGVGKALIDYIFLTSELNKLTVINVNDEATNTKSFFEGIGFDNQIDQYEMTLSL